MGLGFSTHLFSWAHTLFFKMNNHDRSLDELIRNLVCIGERPHNIAWIMKERIYMPERSTNYNKMCDLILGYYDRSISLVELKGSKGKKSKAKQQLQSGLELVNLMGYEAVTGKIVYYKPKGRFTYETIF